MLSATRLSSGVCGSSIASGYSGDDVGGAETHLLDLEVDGGDVGGEVPQGGVRGAGHAEVVWLPAAVRHAHVASVVVVAAHAGAGAGRVGSTAGAVKRVPSGGSVVKPLGLQGAVEVDLGCRARLEGSCVEVDIFADAGLAESSGGVSSGVEPVCAAGVHQVVGRGTEVGALGVVDASVHRHVHDSPVSVGRGHVGG